MLNSLSNFNFDHYFALSIAISVIGITFCIINRYREIGNVGMERPIDTTRVHEGLPTDVTLTPEDFRANPELAEIFGVADTDNNLDILLESNEHFQQVENQLNAVENQLNAVENQLNAVDFNNLMPLYDVIVDFISNYF
jgi:uncharacterized protein YpuA (DUF1002 family)